MSFGDAMLALHDYFNRLMDYKRKYENLLSFRSIR
jgi:hypothetical protein